MAKEKEKYIRVDKGKQVVKVMDDNIKEEEIITIIEKSRSSNTKEEKENKESIKIIEQTPSKSEDSIISDEDFKEENLVEEKKNHLYQ